MPNQHSRPSSSSDDGPQSPPSTTVVGATTSTESDPATQRAKSKLAKSGASVAGVSDLIRRVYDGTFKRKRLSKADILAIRTDPRVPAERREELLSTASKDVSLSSTCQLMAILVGYDDSGFTNARDFARQVLKDHPAFQRPDIVATLTSQSDALRPEKAVECLASQDFLLLTAEAKQNRSKAELTKRSRECKENAIRCLLLWLSAQRKISLDRTLQLLHEYVWATYTQRQRSPENQLRALIAAKQTGAQAASIASELLEKQVTQQSYRTEAAMKAEARAVAKVEELQQELEVLQREHTASLDQARLLDQELASQRTAHADERAHLQDEYERLRGTVLRRLKDELMLMEEGLHALQRDPPRVHVMVDHADRVIDGLRLAIDRLREGREG